MTSITHHEITRSYDTRWDHNYAALLQYVERTGTSRVPSGHAETFEGRNVPLGTWVAAQRHRYHLPNSPLPAGRIAKLEALRGWTWGPLASGPREKADRNAAIRAQRAAGRSLAAIASEFGVSRQRVHQILARSVASVD